MSRGICDPFSSAFLDMDILDLYHLITKILFGCLEMIKINDESGESAKRKPRLDGAIKIV